MKYDLISFGDITIDSFIRLKTADVHGTDNNGGSQICMPFGTKIPFESATDILSVGNAPNAAVCVARLGLASATVVSVGNDIAGNECTQALVERGVSKEYVTIEASLKTNHHYVLQYGAERTILIKHEPYPRTLPVFAETPRWLYLTSLPIETLDFQIAIARYAVEHGARLAFQPGTFQLELGTDKLAEVYRASEIFFCNKEEAQQILGTREDDAKKLMEGIRALGPKIAVITDGPKGANVMDNSGAWHIPMYPDPAPPVSRTGAGDATAATTVAYIIKGMTPKDALMRGIINAASGVQAVHVQLGTLTEAGLEEWYSKRPADFVATQL